MHSIKFTMLIILNVQFISVQYMKYMYMSVQPFSRTLFILPDFF